MMVEQGLGKDMADQYTSALWLRRDEVRRCVANNEFRSCAPPLRDFDFKVQLVLASSMLANQEETLLQLQLQSGSLKDGPPKSAIVEFTLEELESFIDTLEDLEKSMLRLSDK